MGTRVEQTDIRPDGMAGFSYTSVSASASAVWKLGQRNSFNLAVTRSSRAPQVQELLSDGFHHATRSWERGNAALKEETSYNLDLGYRFKTDWLRAELDLFHNWASDYIYQRRTGEFLDEEGTGDHCDTEHCVPVLQSSQQDAIFKGYEAKLIFPVLENHLGLLELTLFSDYTRGEFVNGGDVPRMPPLRYGLQLDYNKDKLSSYLRLTRADDQTHVATSRPRLPVITCSTWASITKSSLARRQADGVRQRQQPAGPKHPQRRVLSAQFRAGSGAWGGSGISLKLLIRY
ncbi:TonB-dependent receptor [Methylomonas koyamae]|uniref:TonB-dependent receptor n=1 Tax=Methylomonas koyamae TaxID=702114 RepID=UPI00272DCFC3|nr:TonB-dependent receptor [Methylomonas koyamae]